MSCSSRARSVIFRFDGEIGDGDGEGEGEREEEEDGGGTSATCLIATYVGEADGEEGGGAGVDVGMLGDIVELLGAENASRRGHKPHAV